MAAFKVGQRVKCVAGLRPEDRKSDSRLFHGLFGCCGTIVSIPIPHYPDYGDCIVAFDGAMHDSVYGGVAAHYYQLAPLTGPLAEAWAADAVRKLVKPEPIAPPLPAKERSL